MDEWIEWREPKLEHLFSSDGDLGMGVIYDMKQNQFDLELVRAEVVYLCIKKMQYESILRPIQSCQKEFKLKLV